MFPILLFCGIVLYTVFAIINVVGSKKVPKDTVVAFTGGLGTGKTLIAVNQSIKAYKRSLLLWKLGFYDKKYKFKKFLPKKRIKAEMPLFYSNIPIRIKRPIFINKKEIKEKEYFSQILTYEHLIMTDKIREYSVVLIDEIGQIADQYQFDNPFVMQSIQEFIRFFRHFVDGRMFVTDQSSSNIVVAVRRRLNVIYNLHEFRRYMLYFYRVNVSTVLISEDMLSINKVDDKEHFEYFTGHLPLKWFKFLDLTRFFSYKKYESRVYKKLYEHVQYKNEDNSFNEYFTKYLIEIPNNADMKKEFKKKGFLTAKEMDYYIKEYKKIRD